MKKLTLVLLLCTQSLGAHTFFTNQQAQQAWQERDYDKAREILETALVHHPQDGELNYNLGSVYHMIGMFDAASESFKRALAVDDVSDELREQSLFNLGNTSVQKAQALLGPNWEKREIVQETLDKASEIVLEAIDRYNDVLGLTEEHKRAATNREYAQELYEKLQKKKQEQEEDKQDKQDENKQEQKNDQDQGDKQQDQQPQPDQAEKGSPRPDSENKPQENNADQDPGKSGDMEGSDKQQDREGGDDRSGDGQENPQADNDSGTGAGSAQPLGEESADRQEKDAMLALLESLDAKEAEKHKAFIARHVQSQAQPRPGQKNW